MNKFFLLDKPAGISSFKCIYPLKKLYKKVGHSGTLDPCADGLLVVAVGRATKFIRFLPYDKAYEFTIKFGVKTDSDDLDGNVVETNNLLPSLLDLQGVLTRFVGVISQVPSRFSAVKVNGKRAYELARKGVDVQVPERLVSVYNLQLISFDGNKASFFVKCSKGTYVRSLSSDICKALGVLGCVVKLRRVVSNGFSLNNGVSEVGLDCFKQFYSVLTLKEEGILSLRNGGCVFQEPSEPGVYTLVDFNGVFIGLVEVIQNKMFKLCFV